MEREHECTRQDACLVVMFLTLGLVVFIGCSIGLIAPYYRVHSGPCKVTFFQAQQVLRTEDGCQPNLVRFTCNKCNPWPEQCCGPSPLLGNTCLRLNTVLTDCMDDQCHTLANTTHAYDGYWELEDQQKMRKALQPNRTLTCYWSGFDGYHPYKFAKKEGIWAAYILVPLTLCFYMGVAFLNCPRGPNLQPNVAVRPTRPRRTAPNLPRPTRPRRTAPDRLPGEFYAVATPSVAPSAPMLLQGEKVSVTVVEPPPAYDTIELTPPEYSVERRITD